MNKFAIWNITFAFLMLNVAFCISSILAFNNTIIDILYYVSFALTLICWILCIISDCKTSKKKDDIDYKKLKDILELYEKQHKDKKE